MTIDKHNLLTVTQALELLGISRATFDRWKKEKQLPYIKIGKEVFINKDKLHHWMEKFDFSSSRSSLKSAEPTPIHIGYQTGSAQLWSSIVIKRLNLFIDQLTATLPEQAFEVIWHNANNGIELVQQFISDRLHLVAVGDFPIHICFNLARLFPNFNPLLIAFDGKTTRDDGIALVVQQDFDINQLSPHIATVSSTSSSYHLQQLMKKNNQPFHAIAKPSMESCMNSFLQQEVDAAMLWEPYLSIVEELGVGKRVLADEHTIYLTGLLANYHIKHEPLQQTITIAYLKALLLAHDLLNKQDEQAIEAIAHETGYSFSLIKKVIAHIRYDAAVYYEDIKRLNKIYTDSSPVLSPIDTDLYGLSNPKIHFDAAYLNQAIHELKLPELQKQHLTGQWMEHRY